MEIRTINSGAPAETRALGEQIGKSLDAGSLILLKGDLGAGKTLFTQGVASGAGVDSAMPVTSPTYTLMNIYHGRLPIYHFDLYRLEGGGDVDDLGFDEYFEGDGIALVEWAERAPELQRGALLVEIDHVDESSRTIRLTFDETDVRYAGIGQLLNQVEQ